MLQKNILSCSRDELSDVLRILKEYRTSLKQIGNRAVLSDSKNKKAKTFRIEHTSTVSEDFVRQFSDAAIQKYFPEASKDVIRNFAVNNRLIGGIRIFYGDDMLDLSFQDFVRAI